VIVADRCVYMHLTPDTNRVFYIGMGSAKRAFIFNKRNKHWQKIVEKHGKPEVVVIARNLTIDQAADIEKFWIRHHGLEKLANISPGGDGVGGFNHTEESKLKIAIAGIGRKHSEKSKEKMRLARLGKPISRSNIEKIKIANTNRRRTDEHNQKLFDANVSKLCYCFENDNIGKIICTQYELRKIYNLKGPRLSELIHGKRNKYKGWRVNRSSRPKNQREDGRDNDT